MASRLPARRPSRAGGTRRPLRGFPRQREYGFRHPRPTVGVVRRRLLLTIAALAAAALLVWAVEPLRVALGHVLHGDVDALQAQLRDLGVTGALIVVALILLHAVVFFPAEIVNATAGLAFGFWVAFPLVLVSWVLSGLIAYWLGQRRRAPAGGAAGGGAPGRVGPSS